MRHVRFLRPGTACRYNTVLIPFLGVSFGDFVCGLLGTLRVVIRPAPRIFTSVGNRELFKEPIGKI